MARINQPSQSPLQKRSYGLAGFGVVIVIVIISVMSVVIYYICRKEVPNCINKRIEKAEILISEAGFSVGKVNWRKSNKVERGWVISQKPAPLKKVIPILWWEEIELTTSSGKPLVVVPDLYGQPYEQAHKKLVSDGFKIKISKSKSREFNDGYIFNQEPTPGDNVPYGSDVTIFVSTGLDLIEIPNVIGENLSEATKKLRIFGLDVSTSYEKSHSVQRGYVISQNPTSGSLVYPGSLVSLTASSGRGKPISKKLPFVVGKDEYVAASILIRGGFEVKKTSSENSEIFRDGLVIRQSLMGHATPGSTVWLTISNGPARKKCECGALNYASSNYCDNCGKKLK